MSESKSQRGKTFILLAFMVIFGSSGDVLLSQGMKRLGELHSWALGSAIAYFARAFVSGTIWMGIALLIAFLVSYMLVLSWADFSYVSPASAIGYVLVALMGYFILGEHVPTTRWVGVGLICVGVFVVGGTHPSTSQNP
ncbi:MAG: EamA family transporter [Acidobacteria bacterium]|nr:MAG: EamA family transporter [Acidobacteriota bacterium]